MNMFFEKNKDENIFILYSIDKNQETKKLRNMHNVCNY